MDNIGLKFKATILTVDKDVKNIKFLLAKIILEIDKQISCNKERIEGGDYYEWNIEPIEKNETN
jgi:hypothetical protein